MQTDDKKRKDQEGYVLTITQDNITSTDPNFDIDDLEIDNKYEAVETYFISNSGKIVERKLNRGEKKCSNRTMARLAFQIFEDKIKALSAEEKKKFPVCRYGPEREMIHGIFNSLDEYKKYKNTRGYLTYEYDNGKQFVIYAWNIFSNIIFVKECLKRFGRPGDSFVLAYREKEEHGQPDDDERNIPEYIKNYSSKLLKSKNIIFRGAPGTGKTYMAKQIAAYIISDGSCSEYNELNEEQKKQVEFVQFHPSYDYTDFVEGLRPRVNEDGSMGFQLQDGIFKKFVERARKNYENAQKSEEVIRKEISAEEAINDFFSEIEFGVDKFKTIKGNEFFITNVDSDRIYISIPGNETVNKLTLKVPEIRAMLESGEDFKRIKDIIDYFNKPFYVQAYSYDFALYKAIRENMKTSPDLIVRKEKNKKYIFIIDEINRGEISKILGELFFAIDPGYRGKKGEVSTQYSNLHEDPDKKFYIPENVYIIGTMNDIDRSVDSFDFAMRRRFRFIEVKASDSIDILDEIKNEEIKIEAIKRMEAINKEIVMTEDLSENYQIGAAYFLKLKDFDYDFDQLWTDNLEPLLQDYVRGMYNEDEIMDRFKKAYGYIDNNKGNGVEDAED